MKRWAVSSAAPLGLVIVHEADFMEIASGGVLMFKVEGPDNYPPRLIRAIGPGHWIDVSPVEDS